MKKALPQPRVHGAQHRGTRERLRWMAHTNLVGLGHQGAEALEPGPLGERLDSIGTRELETLHFGREMLGSWRAACVWAGGRRQGVLLAMRPRVRANCFRLAAWHLLASKKSHFGTCAYVLQYVWPLCTVCGMAPR